MLATNFLYLSKCTRNILENSRIGLIAEMVYQHNFRLWRRPKHSTVNSTLIQNFPTLNGLLRSGGFESNLCLPTRDKLNRLHIKRAIKSSMDTVSNINTTSSNQKGRHIRTTVLCKDARTMRSNPKGKENKALDQKEKHAGQHET